MTEDQVQSLKTWAEERDALLHQIAGLSNTKNTLLEETKVLGIAKSALQDDIASSNGRLEELNKKEQERISLISLDVYEKQQEKNLLENDLALLKKDVETLLSTKESINSDFLVYIPLYEKISKQIVSLQEIINTVVRVSQENTKDFNVLISAFSKIIKDVLGELEQVSGFSEKIQEVTRLNIESANNVNHSVGILSKNIKELN